MLRKVLWPMATRATRVCLTIQTDLQQQQIRFVKHVSALRPKKPKSERKETQFFSDHKRVRVMGGKGGDGCISFLQLWANERAGPDGGDGGNGGHVLFEASEEVRNFNHVTSLLSAESGEKGANKDCHGRNAKHTIIKVPVGTVIRDMNGNIVGDLSTKGLIFVAARGGAGGKGNSFFASSAETAPKICEYGPEGEDFSYILELRSMADIGFIGFPNAGKSTLLNAITRARPKVAPYAFTTLRPHLGIVQYSDHEQLAVADLPGLIEGSHRNKGLGIQFLKHAERCSVLMFVLDVSLPQPWLQYEKLMFELNKFSDELVQRPHLVVANKIDQIEEVDEQVGQLRAKLNLPVIGISAKFGTNLTQLLIEMRLAYEKYKPKEKREEHN